MPTREEILAARARDPRWNLFGSKAYADPAKLTGHGMNLTDAINAGFTPTPWAPSTGAGPGTRGYHGSGVVGSAAGALGSKGMPTSMRGRLEKYGSLNAANMTTKQASDVTQGGFGGLREIFNRINPAATMPSVPAVQPKAQTQALPEIPASLTITHPEQVSTLPGAVPNIVPPASGSVLSTNNPLDATVDPNDPLGLKKKKMAPIPGMVANPILPSVFAGLQF